jgi:hypothetical protein
MRESREIAAMAGAVRRIRFTDTTHTMAMDPTFQRRSSFRFVDEQTHDAVITVGTVVG